eukprot:Hpha_TRINITY_DN16906_c1_g11::TRINITY_DN16906_c1_g11_i2::g.55275::m.55275
MPAVGDTVTVKYDAKDPGGRWGGVEPGSRGVLSSVNPYIVDFPEIRGFVARASELEFAGGHPEDHRVERREGGEGELAIEEVTVAHGGDHEYVKHEHNMRGEGREDGQCRFSDQKLEEMFGMFDCDGSGEVDHAEAELLLHSVGMNLEEGSLQEWFDSVDKDHSGK